MIVTAFDNANAYSSKPAVRERIIAFTKARLLEKEQHSASSGKAWAAYIAYVLIGLYTPSILLTILSGTGIHSGGTDPHAKDHLTVRIYELVEGQKKYYRTYHISVSKKEKVSICFNWINQSNFIM